MSPSTPEQNTQPPAPRVLVGALFRERRQRVALREAPPPAPVRRPAHVARMLALAHHLQSAIDRGAVPDRAAVAKRLGLTRARVTQLLDLLLLAPDLQDQVLHLEAVDGAEPLSERTLRAVAQAAIWEMQRARWSKAFGAPQKCPAPAHQEWTGQRSTRAGLVALQPGARAPAERPSALATLQSALSAASVKACRSQPAERGGGSAATGDP